MENHWYAFYTRSRAEKKVWEYLNEREVKTFLPLMNVLKQWSDRKRWVKQVLIPGYVFVYAKEKELVSLLSIPNIVAILKVEGKPAIIPPEEIENLRIITSETPNVQVLKNVDLEKGTPIEIIRGPLHGLKGYYLAPRGKNKIIVHFESLNNFIEVELRLSDIKKTT